MKARLRRIGSLAATALFLAACERGVPAANQTEPTAATNEAKPETSRTVLDLPLSPLDRAGLLALAARAADSAASGQPPDPASKALVGRSFEIRLPFGCTAVSAPLSGGWASWTYDPKQHVLKLIAKPDLDLGNAAVASAGHGMSVDAAQGFWVRRPWTSSETCPPPVEAPVTPPPPDAPDRTAIAGPAQSTPSAPPPRETLGLVQFFTPDAPRTLRRGNRPYSFTVRSDAAPAPGDVRLKLTGRLAGFADGRPAHCTAEGTDLRPICILAVEFTSVAFEDSRDGSTIAEWRQ